ncbi:MAG: HDIG domain-containing protein [Ignavibacteriota bacterium]|nr:MAG: HDIG domain-containing protein [Chlorobiota bacterium]MBE7476111.1 HDIG domain-containing protein [Ignavibacteriales bacterium]MBL1124102.1 HDIG domain-containing protein [Ignavibacteriota bacterium]MCC7093710.1 HDIG domain-containing protein [Ignavibacteriaceae bacterium]MCE7857202.1 HDIG domain-containing protein [Ignavibacteria bacterium CHB3]MEB2295361.1 HDIG domain-containing protein [Ignavibacteria bacterium]
MDNPGNKKSGKGLFTKFLLGFVTIILIVIMFPKGESIEFEVSEGAIWLYDDLIAPFSFPIKKSDEVYSKEVNAAKRSVYPVFLDESTNKQKSIETLKNYNAYLIKAIDESIETKSTVVTNPTFLSTPSFLILQNLRIKERNLIRSGNQLKNFFNAAVDALSSIYVTGVLSIDTGTQLRDSIALRKGNFDTIEPISEYLFLDQVKKEIAERVERTEFTEEIKTALLEYTTHFLLPTIVFSSELTDEETTQAQNNVSRYSGIVNENERIIAKHDRITKDIKLKIESYKEAKGDLIGQGASILQSVGKFFHIGLILSLLVTYLYLFRKKIFYDNQKLLMFVIIILFVSFVTFLINQVKVQAPLQYMIFIPAASMLLTIMFDSRIGFYSTVIMTLITGALRGNDYTFMTMNLIAGGIAVYSVRDIKNRSQIFRSFLFILLGYILSIFAFGFERFATVDNMLIESAFAATNALISPVLTYGLLIFFERFFKITTDLTLLELSNFDRPLLKELARKAPGTFNHSMTMGTLAEAAAEKIGANPLLARIGAYYHDVGKTISPQNFVENQLNNQNVHENLTPEESVSMIVQHVNEGIELAKENKLPKEIIDFIPMHHGRMVMSYFYERAKKIYGEEKVKVDDFRYPGPKPNTKETAIVMLADGCESAVRSIENPDPTKVENVIDSIFKSRIDDRQLEDSPVNFRDIKIMKEEFLNILLGQHHRRIKYPKQEEAEKGIQTENK